MINRFLPQYVNDLTFLQENNGHLVWPFAFVGIY